METTHLKKWTRPDSYMGAEWPEHFVFLGQHRDSDTLSRSNFRTAQTALEKLPPFEPANDETESRFTVRESHWAVGWVEWLAIHETDTAAIEAAEEMLARLENYPVLDEWDFSELEQEEADQTWKVCYSPKERVEYVRKYSSQFDFRNFADLLGCIRGKYFAGYASELLN